MKITSIKSFCDYTNANAPKHDHIDVGAYSPGFLLSSPPVYPDFYRVSIKYGLEHEKAKGYMYFSSPNQAIEWNTAVPWEGYYINIAETLISSNQHLEYSFLSYGLHEALFLQEEEAKTITSLFTRALNEYEKESFSVNILLAYCNLMFAYIAEFYKRQFGEQKERYTKLVDDFFTLLNAYYKNLQEEAVAQPSVSHFADQLNVTPNYLSDIVRYYTGKSALNHIHQYIINTAKPLILQNKFSVAEIAYKLGFEYPNYFSRLFRKQTGFTPSKFRQQ